MSQAEMKQVMCVGPTESGWKSLYKLGGTTVLMAAAIPLVEIGIDFLPGVERASHGAVTASDWFALFQTHWFLGLRNLGLLNLIAAALLAPTVLAIYSALRRHNEAYAAAPLSPPHIHRASASDLPANRLFLQPQVAIRGDTVVSEPNV